MKLVHSYVHPTPMGGRCRIRLYLPEEDTSADAPVIVCTEFADNPAMSITKSASMVAGAIPCAHHIEGRVVWIEHFEDGARGSEEDPHTFDLVSFEHYVPCEAPGPDGWHMRIGEPTGKALDRTTVETLIGGEFV